MYTISTMSFDTLEEALDKIMEFITNGTLKPGTKVFKVGRDNYFYVGTKSVRPGITPLNFIRGYSHISPTDLDDILETLEDSGYLSSKGSQFRKEFWEMFIKEE